MKQDKFFDYNVTMKRVRIAVVEWNSYMHYTLRLRVCILALLVQKVMRMRRISLDFRKS